MHQRTITNRSRNSQSTWIDPNISILRATMHGRLTAGDGFSETPLLHRVAGSVIRRYLSKRMTTTGIIGDESGISRVGYHDNWLVFTYLCELLVSR
jgi:hypothetical protein